MRKGLLLFAIGANILFWVNEVILLLSFAGQSFILDSLGSFLSDVVEMLALFQDICQDILFPNDQNTKLTHSV